MYHKSLFPPLPQLPPQNVHNLLLGHPDQASWPDFPLHVDALSGASRSFREFLEIVRDGATAMGSNVGLGGLGIRASNDELVGILCENCMDCIALVHSLLVLTVPFVSFSSYSTAFELQHTFKLAAPTRLFVTPTLLPLALTLGFSDDRIYVLDGRVQGRTSYMDLVARARTKKMARLPVQPAQKDTLAHLVFSSGTSGLPKAVMISHGNLIDSIFQMIIWSKESFKVKGPMVWRGPGGRNVILNVLPMHHAYGLHVTSFKCFFAPTTVVLLSKWDPKVFFDSIPKYCPTTVYLVPSLAHQLVHHPRFPTTDFSNVQHLHCSSAHLPPSLSQILRPRFPNAPRVGEGYGMSECTLSVSLQPIPGLLEGRAKYVPGSVGVLMPGVEARIVREDGQLAAVNEPGEIYVRSGSVALGYYKNREATDETFRDGWLRTGDLMRMDADGVLYFEERVKDTLKISGMQVSPTEIEVTLLGHPDKLVTDVAVAGVSGGRTSVERVPRAWIVLSARGKTLGATEVVARLDAWIRETLSRYKWLRGGFAVVDQIPKSPTGKVLRRALVDGYEAEVRSRGGKL